ncbi:MAG: hypothetical protein C3F06_05160 [Candidatus Methanoperedenaceae archaeon]|nr:MAG: hypothetical protein C3F06_05160 [Candidatus Methanoperedenaceae archaeon]
MSDIKKSLIIRKSNLILVIISIISLAIVTGCIDEEKKNADNATLTPEKTPAAVISSSSEGIMEKFNLQKLVSMSDTIIVGNVTEVFQSKWNTPDGNKPMNNSTSNIIYTDVNIKVFEYLQNPLDAASITVRVLGGIVGQDSINVEDQPSYSPGETVVLFLKNDADPRTKDIGEKHFVTAGLAQGKISVLQNNVTFIGDEKMSLDDIRVRIKGK